MKELFIPPIYYKIKKKFSSVKSYQKSPLPQIMHTSDKIIVLGNGPSLQTSVDRYKKEIIKFDRICVNFFGSTDLYEVIKPNIYVFADPAFFWIPDNQKESMEALFNNIVDKTSWPLQIIVPLGAKGASIEDKLLSNSNIKIDYYFDGCQDVQRLDKYEAWDNNIVGPPAMNVLNVAVYLCIYWNYRETYLIGADSSFLENLYMDQNDNVLYSLDHHFYEKNKVYHDSFLFDNQSRREIGTSLADELKCQMTAFKAYEELEKYARYKNIKIYNASEYSWIDAFERKKLEEIN